MVSRVELSRNGRLIYSADPAFAPSRDSLRRADRERADAGVWRTGRVWVSHAGGPAVHGGAAQGWRNRNPVRPMDRRRRSLAVAGWTWALEYPAASRGALSQPVSQTGAPRGQCETAGG